ncbi:MAG: hypothetical protein GX767_00495 [Firmicutes bacterium]|nr:hypothetical protein [Bacillota bacterium]
MFLRWGGAVLIVAAAYYMGLDKAKALQVRSSVLNQFQYSLGMLAMEINYGLTPLPTACKSLSNKVKAPVNSFYYSLYSKLENGAAKSMQEVWYMSLEEKKESMFLEKADLDILLPLGAVMNLEDRKGIIKHLYLAQAQLRQAFYNAEEKRQKMARMYIYLGLLGGMLLVIILI